MPAQGSSSVGAPIDTATLAGIIRGGVEKSGAEAKAQQQQAAGAEAEAHALFEPGQEPPMAGGGGAPRQSMDL